MKRLSRPWCLLLVLVFTLAAACDGQPPEGQQSRRALTVGVSELPTGVDPDSPALGSISATELMLNVG